MLPPIRCFTCGKVIADQYDYYMAEVQKLKAKEENPDRDRKSEKDRKKESADARELRHFDGVLTGPIMDKLGLRRYCCRRMMLGTHDMMDVI